MLCVTWVHAERSEARTNEFGLFPFRSPLLRESPRASHEVLFSFPPGTEMFHFPGFAAPLRGDLKC